MKKGNNFMFDLMSIKDFAKEIKKPESTIRTWKRRKDIPENIFKDIAGTVFVRPSKFREWLDNSA